MLPMGGTKGAMLALVVELLVTALTGAAFGFEATRSSSTRATGRGSARRSSSSIPTRWPAARSTSTASRRWSRRCCEDAGVRLPGHRRAALAEEAARNGVAIPEALAMELARRAA